MSKHWLGDALAATVSWKATDNPPPDDDMTKLATEQWHINKYLHYFPIYDKAFHPYRNKAARILEIGVNMGGSLELWRNYFQNPAAEIVGIDIHPGCAVLDHPARNIHVRIGAQQDHNFLKTLIDELGPFDIILDDGSHIPSYTLQAFQYLFPHGLADGGVYLVEDLFSCYCPEGREPFGDPAANDGSPTFIEFAKYLIDVMHEVYRHTPTGRQVAEAFEPEMAARRTEFPVTLAATTIAGMEFYDSIVVIHKNAREVPRIIRRWSLERLASVMNWGPARINRLVTRYPNIAAADRTRKDWLS